jgi:hypothetical protein
MQRTPQELVEHILKLRSERRVGELVDLYSPDAMIARHEGSARGHDEIRSFLAGFLTAQGKFDVVSIDALSECDDVILWDATIETTPGPLQITEVVVLDERGLIRRHVPGLRGYWGR